MKDRVNFLSWTGWASPLALRATPSGTGSVQPVHDHPDPGRSIALLQSNSHL